MCQVNAKSLAVASHSNHSYILTVNCPVRWNRGVKWRGHISQCFVLSLDEASISEDLCLLLKI